MGSILVFPPALFQIPLHCLQGSLSGRAGQEGIGSWQGELHHSTEAIINIYTYRVLLQRRRMTLSKCHFDNFLFVLQCVVIGLQSTGEARTREVLDENEGHLDKFVSAAE